MLQNGLPVRRTGIMLEKSGATGTQSGMSPARTVKSLSRGFI
jgi:hypothetical protein